MSYIEQLVARTFKDGEEVRVNAKELQRLANYALRKEIENNMLKAKIAGYEVIELPTKIKLYEQYA